MGSNWHPKKEILHSPSKNTFLGCGGRDFCVVSCCFFCEFEGVSNVEVELGRRFQDLGRWVATIFLNPGGKGVKPWHISVKLTDFCLKRYIVLNSREIPSLKIGPPQISRLYLGGLVWWSMYLKTIHPDWYHPASWTLHRLKSSCVSNGRIIFQPSILWSSRLDRKSLEVLPKTVAWWIFWGF